MNEASTAEMVAGRELDALVAEKVMKLRVIFDEDRYGEMHIWWAVPTDPGTVEEWDKFYLPAYSTDIAAAWQVIEHMKERGLTVWFVSKEFAWQEAPHWEAGLTVEPCDSGWLPQIQALASAETAPLAICRAALMAVAT